MPNTSLQTDAEYARLSITLDGSMNAMSLTQADAATLLVRCLRHPDHGDYGSYGYGVYLPAMVRTHLAKQGIQHHNQDA